MRPALLLTSAFVASAQDQPPPPALERIKYNNPGLTVDLAVGLWAGPLPMDFDSDGKFDLVVIGTDKPYDGLYFFRNASGGTEKQSLPIFKPGRRISQGKANAQVSYVEGEPHVLTPGADYPDFLNTGFEHPRKLPVPANFPPGKARANVWSYVDFDGDDKLDLIVGADDWTDTAGTMATTPPVIGSADRCTASFIFSAIPGLATCRPMTRR